MFYYTLLSIQSCFFIEHNVTMIYPSGRTWLKFVVCLVIHTYGDGHKMYCASRETISHSVSFNNLTKDSLS